MVIVLVVPTSLGHGAYNLQTKSYVGQAVLVLEWISTLIYRILS
jgi:hypothetical protein